jgi:hypothetical protein
MRYREGQAPDPDYPYAKSTHDALAISYWLAIPIAIVLLWMGIRGRILWLKVWSIGLLLLSFVLILDGWFGFLRVRPL